LCAINKQIKLKINTILGVVKKDRKKGLGDKLVKHALNYAREQDCSHAHTLASGIFSQVGFFYEFD
jgi:N-acetylglutamate synthase-like GNAT family acetyltransferase